MVIEFPGTRGEIEERSEKHRYHSSIVISYRDTKILIDYGEKHNPDLEGNINFYDAVFITHAHPDHYIWTLREDRSVFIPVYLTRTSLDYSRFRPVDHRVIEEGVEISFKDLRIRPLKVMHSLRCPAVCYRIEGGKNLIYAPDLIDIVEGKESAFQRLDYLIADGSSLYTNMVRKRDGKLFGHTMIKTVINWCKKYGIGHLIITHCGKQVVTMDETELDDRLLEYSEGMVDVKIAYDGYRVKL